MLQIISNSNETSTGPELVQNGNFSQLGADLVENGLFDQLGTDVITNGGFTGETELITNGDFASGTTGWSAYQGSLSVSGGALVVTATANNDTRVKTNITTVAGKSYRLTAELKSISGTKVGVGNANNSFTYSGNVQELTSIGSYDYYFTPSYTATSIVFKMFDASTGETFSLDNVSVKEVGEDWTNGTGWSFGDSKAISTQALGSEEVTNGDFSAAGINLVDNPNFTDTGVELMANYDFASGLTDWNPSGVTESGGVVYINASNQSIYQGESFTLGESYKAVIEGAGDVRYRTGTAGADATYLPITLPATVYFVATADSSIFQVRGSNPSSSATVSSVSVKELGADWTVTNADATHYVEFIETGARFVSLTTSPILVFQQTTFQLLANKSYKLTVDMTRVSGGVKFDSGGVSEIFSATTSGTNNTRYITPTSNVFLTFIRSSSNVDLTFHSVSVQELGQDWTVGTGWSIGEDKAIATSTGGILSQSISFVSTKNYKLTYDIVSNSGDLFIQTNVLSLRTITESGSYVDYFTTTTDNILRFNGKDSSPFDGSVTNVSVKEIATSYLTQAVSLSAKTWKIIYSVSDYIAGSVSATDYGAVTTANAVGITEYVEIGATSDFRMVNIDGYFEGAVTDISAQLVDPNGYWTLGTGWTFGDDKATFENSSGAGNISQYNVLEATKSYKLTFDTLEATGNFAYAFGGGYIFITNISANTTHTVYGVSTGTTLNLRGASNFAGSITNISVEQTDPNNYWTLGTGWSIGTDKAISTITSSNSDITQSILTAGKTYRTVYEIVDYDAGTAQAVVTGSAGADAVAIETYTEDLTTTGTDFSIRSKLGTFDGAVSSVSAKLLGSYEDQSIYVTAADVQTLPQASVYYLVELTSMASKNSIYFIPSSVVPNNGRYTKLNFTVVSKDALTQPTVGIISFYDSVGGFDTYPMGFYEFKIYEQTSSTNLDPLLATGLLEKGFAFVRDFSGNMQELTDGFKEYNPTLTQYVYSK